MKNPFRDNKKPKPVQERPIERIASALEAIVRILEHPRADFIRIGASGEETIGGSIVEYPTHSDMQRFVDIFPEKGSTGKSVDFDAGCKAEADTGQAVGIEGPITDPDGKIHYRLHTPPPADPVAAPVTIVTYGDVDGFPGGSFTIPWIHPEADTIREGATGEEPIT